MSVVDRHWVELLVLVAACVGWIAYRRVFAHLPVYRRRDGGGAGE